MQITKYKHRGISQLSQLEYINHVLQRYKMGDAKLVSTPLEIHFHLYNYQSLQRKEERGFMVKVPYALTIRSLIYVTVCMRPNFGHAMGIVSRYMKNLGKAHWVTPLDPLSYLGD